MKKNPGTPGFSLIQVGNLFIQLATEYASKPQKPGAKQSKRSGLGSGCGTPTVYVLGNGKCRVAVRGEVRIGEQHQARALGAAVGAKLAGKVALHLPVQSSSSCNGQTAGQQAVANGTAYVAIASIATVVRFFSYECSS